MSLRNTSTHYSPLPLFLALTATILFGCALYFAGITHNGTREGLSENAYLTLPRLEGALSLKMTELLRSSEAMATQRGARFFVQVSTAEKPRQMIIRRNHSADLLFELSRDGNHFRIRELYGDGSWEYYRHPGLVRHLHRISG